MVEEVEVSGIGRCGMMVVAVVVMMMVMLLRGVGDVGGGGHVDV